MIASIAGSTPDEYVRVASHLHLQPGVVALEINLSAPDEERRRRSLLRAPRADERDRRAGRPAAPACPVFAKLPPLLPDLVAIARACVRAGAHGLTLIDARPRARGRRASGCGPRLAAPVGGLSGPAIKPIALAAVYRVARALPEVPIMGVGGIATGEDAVEFLLAGAWAVQVGTALLVEPVGADGDRAGDPRGTCKAKGIASPGDLRGGCGSGEAAAEPPADVGGGA